MNKFIKVGAEYRLETAKKVYHLTIEENNTISLLEKNKETKYMQCLLTSTDISEIIEIMPKLVKILQAERSSL